MKTPAKKHMQGAEEAPLGAESKSHFFDISQDVFVVANMDGKILLANPAHANVLGTDFSRAATFIELVHPDDRPRALRHLETIQQGQGSGLECRAVTGDGTYKWMSWLATPVPSENRIYAIGRDISLRKAAESRANQLAAVVESLSDAVVSTNTDFEIESWNNGARTLFGYTLEEAEHMRLDELFAAPDGATVELEMGVHEEHLCLRKDGRTFIGSTLLSEVHDEYGACVGFALLTRDISERKEVERRVKEFYSTISHELRTPLASIRGVLGLLAGGLVDFESPESIELVGAAKESSDRLIRLINNILDLQKIESGKLDLTTQRLNPEVLAELAAREVRFLSEQCSVSLRMHCDPDVPGIIADRDKITQVLTNLLANAIKFSPPGETVNLTIGKTKNGVRFAISDRGTGIPPEHAHKLFGKFQQIDSSDSRKFTGSGLGLAISKALVEAHNGTIGYYNEQPGCTFWFELPAEHLQPED